METAIGGAIVGAAVAVVTPYAYSGGGAVLRTFAKEVIKGGILLQRAASDLVSEVSRQYDELAAEAQAELAEASRAKDEPAKVGVARG